MHRITSFLGIIIITLIACSDVSTRTIKENQELWESYKTNRYAFDFERSCFCPILDSARVVVNGDSIEAVLHQRTGDLLLDVNDSTYVLDKYGQDYFVTIDDIFEEIKEHNNNPSAGEVEAAFHPDHGYPTSAYIDRLKDAIDDEVSYNIKNVEIF